MTATIPHILNSSGITVFTNRPHSITHGDIRYDAVCQAVKDGDSDALEKALTLTAEKIASDFVLEGGDNVSLDDVPVVGPLASKLVRLIREGFPTDHMKKFVRNLRENPSHAAMLETYDFLAYKELPITENGTFLAYKGIRDDYWSSTAGETRLKKGKVNEHGRIYNGVGETIECDRNAVDDDRRHDCSNGLHVGSHAYAKGFASRTVVVEVNPKDVVSVPLDCNCQKMRVCAYKVVGDYNKELNTAMATPTGEEILSPHDELKSKIVDKVENHLMNGDGTELTLRRLQSRLSPACPSLHQIQKILSNEGYTVAIDSENPTSLGAAYIVD